MDNILRSNFVPFTCINIGDDLNEQERVLNDLSIDCFGKTNTFWKFGFGLPILLIVCLLSPIVIIIALKKNINENKIRTPSI